MEANLAAAEVERAALSAARDEASSEAHTLNRRIEAIRSRAATAEKLLSEARQSLVARAEEVRIAERKTAEATIARNTTQKLVEQLTAARDALEGKTKELERGRASLIERSHILAETVKARETALGQAEQEIKSLTDRIAEIEFDAGHTGPRRSAASKSSVRAFSANAPASPPRAMHWTAREKNSNRRVPR